MSRILVTSLIALLVAGCSNSTSTAAALGHSRLKADALAMIERWETTSPSDRSIPSSFWPDSIRSLDPVEVYPHMFGVLVVTSKSNRYHYGVYIVTDDDDEEESNPSSGSGLSYSPISRGLHQAVVKIRQTVSPR